MNAEIFEQEGKTVWVNNDIHSVGIMAESSSLNLETGFVQDEKFMYWIKANSEESAKSNAIATVKKVNSGALTMARVFSTKPFYPEQGSDINPKTGVVLDRYSKVVLCTPTRRDDIHRTFVAESTVVANEEIAQVV
jgi:hypothetical protein